MLIFSCIKLYKMNIDIKKINVNFSNLTFEDHNERFLLLRILCLLEIKYFYGII